MSKKDLPNLGSFADCFVDPLMELHVWCGKNDKKLKNIVLVTTINELSEGEVRPSQPPGGNDSIF